LIELLYEKMTIPATCHLGKRVFKKLFFENATLTATDKRAFRDDIDTILWQYTLKPTTIQIKSYEDDHREYHEVAILQVNLKNTSRHKRIAEVIHRAIPYPIMVVLFFETSFVLSLANKRFSQAEHGAIVADEFYITDSVDLSVLTDIQKVFLTSLSVTSLPHTHFFAFYSALIDRVIALNCAKLTGGYRLETSAEKRRKRRKNLIDCHELEVQIAEHKAAIRKEQQFNRQVELNTKIKQLERCLKTKVDTL